MKKMKEYLAICLCMASVATQCLGVQANDISEMGAENYGRGNIAADEEAEEGHIIGKYSDVFDFFAEDDAVSEQLVQIDDAVLYSDDQVSTVSSSSFPSSVDLSTSQYFPPILSQGSQGSCAAFSVAYYQYTYEANKLHETSAKSSVNIASPAWVYNYTNGGENKGITYVAALEFLQNHGAVSINTMPYNEENYWLWCSNVSAMRNALSTRVANWVVFNMNGTVTGVHDSDLNTIKSFLYAGKVVTASSDMNCVYGNNSKFGNVIYECKKKTTDRNGHRLTIVGYDDDVYYDVNGDGKIVAAERGAFKVANSWGTDWGNKGYCWILYDALNKKTQVSGYTQASDRVAMFSLEAGSDEKNKFVAIYVKDFEVNLVAQVGFSAERRGDLQISFKRKGASSNGEYDTDVKNLGGEASYSGKLVFDLGNEMDSLTLNLIDNSWYLYITDSKEEKFIRDVSYAITDNKGKTIAVDNDIPDLDNTTKTSKLTFSLTKGDVNYDGEITSEDSLLVNQNVVSLVEFSNLQIYLADMDNDGEITAQDALAILQNVVGM